MKYKNTLLGFSILLIFLVKAISLINQPAFKPNYENSAQSISNIKYLIYECKYHCGGWADRLKGKQP